MQHNVPGKDRHDNTMIYMNKQSHSAAPLWTEHPPLLQVEAGRIRWEVWSVESRWVVPEPPCPCRWRWSSCVLQTTSCSLWSSTSCWCTLAKPGWHATCCRSVRNPHCLLARLIVTVTLMQVCGFTCRTWCGAGTVVCPQWCRTPGSWWTTPRTVPEPVQTVRCLNSFYE